MQTRPNAAEVMGDSWWRKVLRRWMFRWLEDSTLPCTGGGCCTWCPHVTLAQARESFEHNGYLSSKKALPEIPCSCVNAEDENLTPGTRCCACRAFYKLCLPLGSEQRCPCGHVRGQLREDEAEPSLWERFSWWWIWRVWRALRRRCSWCDFRMIPEDEYDALELDDAARDSVSTRHTYLGFGAWACYGCCEYGEG